MVNDRSKRNWSNMATYQCRRVSGMESVVSMLHVSMRYYCDSNEGGVRATHQPDLSSVRPAMSTTARRRWCEC